MAAWAFEEIIALMRNDAGSRTAAPRHLPEQQSSLGFNFVAEPALRLWAFPWVFGYTALHMDRRDQFFE
jgi:hypothetical protein